MSNGTKGHEGEVAEFTGITSPYEVPIEAALVIDTSILTQDESVQRLASLLKD